ncbi:NAD(P)H-dependent oxidoreductase [Wenzhouxiangella sp. XN79A]|uniref:NAD(P)H-dependent oxidoreductase n=1 Tax=Wenzhouxiangella sp. XN79A TaxID=2724193 RepID=UPI00144AE3FC|nr:NAD(P)H-dependent oxidoreductase [Wenzhouxiangella sp. XN79A]NKI36609.1 NAD(P)H-dependent oxidoreductase [Wenzhouxiangella sp. XN79A]
MASRRILVLHGHPDAGQGHFGDALVEAYAEGARQAGHAVVVERLADCDLPPLNSAKTWHEGPVPADAKRLQAAITECEHLVLLYPLWLGDMPAAVKAALEQVLRPGFALAYEGSDPGALLKGKSARVIVTMGMPGFFYRSFYRAHSLKSLKRNILSFCGFRPVRTTAIGRVDSSPAYRARWLKRIRAMGRAGG